MDELGKCYRYRLKGAVAWGGGGISFSVNFISFYRFLGSIPGSRQPPTNEIMGDSILFHFILRSTSELCKKRARRIPKEKKSGNE